MNDRNAEPVGTPSFRWEKISESNSFSEILPQLKVKPVGRCL